MQLSVQSCIIFNHRNRLVAPRIAPYRNAWASSFATACRFLRRRTSSQLDTFGVWTGTRIFSPLAVAGLCVSIGRYMYLFKRLMVVSAGRFYRFEHIVSYSSGKVVGKVRSIPLRNCKARDLNGLFPTLSTVLQTT